MTFYTGTVLSSPVDYGLTAAQTLAHVVSGGLTDADAAMFEAHWAAFREAVGVLPLRWQGNVDAPANEVVIRSLDAMRVVARVSMPESGNVRGVVIASHGYGEVPDGFGEDPEPWTSLGLATVRVRVRGYPPSTIDIADLRNDWIMHRPPHLSVRAPQAANAWIVGGAVADIMQAVRCARAHFGETIHIALHGESLGGGLATIAAAQLTLMNQPPHRLVLALPSLGDWRWRALRYCNGAGGQINVLLDALRGEDRENLLRGLLLYDAALHAPRITAHTLAKLALRDDVVPAPSAAAIFNAIGAPTKWRFTTRFGHYEGGLADARRHAIFERLHPDFADPDRSPEQVISPHAHLMDLPDSAGDSGVTPTFGSAG